MRTTKRFWLLAAMAAIGAVNSFAEIEPNAEGVYEISTTQDLLEFSALVKGGEYSISACLMNDIDLNGIDFEPIAPSSSNTTAFRGTFDGQGHTISNVTIHTDESNTNFVGFFSLVTEGVVENVMLKNVSITTDSGTAIATGALAGRNSSSTFKNVAVIDVTFNLKTVGTKTKGSGGIIGYMSSASASQLLNSYTNYVGTNGISSLSTIGTKATVTNCFKGEDIENTAATGELCYLLNENGTQSIWHQEIGTDAYPVLDSTHEMVRRVKSGDNSFYCNAQVASMTLADAQDYTSTGDFTVSALTYPRQLETGFNSLCLPFAITTEMLGEGSRIFELREVGSSEVALRGVSAVAAGKPCIVWVPATCSPFAALTNVAMVSSVDNSGELKGSFTNTAIGADKYKLAKLSGGDVVFGKTSEAATVAAFRSYIDTSVSVKALSLVLNDGTGIATLTSEKENATAYDLSGRRVQKMTKGVYIVNGKKVMK